MTCNSAALHEPYVEQAFASYELVRVCTAPACCVTHLHRRERGLQLSHACGVLLARGIQRRRQLARLVLRGRQRGGQALDAVRPAVQLCGQLTGKDSPRSNVALVAADEQSC